MTPGRRLVQVDMRFVATEDEQQIGDRIREAVAMIVGREALEEFRVRSLPLDEKPRGLRSVD
jgi:acetylornithine deacetylase/succinyl-diaminopimelate desuccinylase-like protein